MKQTVKSSTSSIATALTSSFIVRAIVQACSNTIADWVAIGKLRGDSVIFLNLLYHTPRLTMEEMNERGRKLFETMVTKGNVDEFVGNRKYIHYAQCVFLLQCETESLGLHGKFFLKFMKEAKEERSSLEIGSQSGFLIHLPLLVFMHLNHFLDLFPQPDATES